MFALDDRLVGAATSRRAALGETKAFPETGAIDPPFDGADSPRTGPLQ
jgi:hypothetical protein